jgi:hypothetical protein
MSFILSLIGLFSKSDLFSRVLVLGLCLLAGMVIVIFIYGILRFWYKKKEIKYIFSLLKAKSTITGKENNFSALLVYAIKKSHQADLYQSLISLFLTTELKIKSFFGVAAVISPLLGLLGTIWGIMNVFLNLQHSADLAAIAPGIAEALITTLAGLFVAIPAMVAYHVFIYFIKSYILLSEAVYEEIINEKK